MSAFLRLPLKLLTVTGIMVAGCATVVSGDVEEDNPPAGTGATLGTETGGSNSGSNPNPPVNNQPTTGGTSSTGGGSSTGGASNTGGSDPGTGGTSTGGSSSGGTTGAGCDAPEWDPAATYTKPDRVIRQGKEYEAQQWTQNHDPATNNGGVGSGQPWMEVGSC